MCRYISSRRPYNHYQAPACVSATAGEERRRHDEIALFSLATLQHPSYVKVSILVRQHLKSTGGHITEVQHLSHIGLSLRPGLSERHFATFSAGHLHCLAPLRVQAQREERLMLLICLNGCRSRLLYLRGLNCLFKAISTGGQNMTWLLAVMGRPIWCARGVSRHID